MRIRISLLIFSLLTMSLLSILFGSIVQVAQSQSTSAPSVTSAAATPSSGQPIASSTPPPAFLTYDQTLNTYGLFAEEVARSAKETIELAKDILRLLAGFGALAVAFVTYMMRQTQLAKDAANSASASAERSASVAEDSRNQLAGLQSQIIETTAALASAKLEVERVNKRMRYLQSENVQQMETLLMLRSSTLKLFSGESINRIVALTTILEYSRDQDPVVRLESIRAIATLAVVPSEISPSTDSAIVRLTEIINDDPEPYLQIEAQKVLRQLKSDL